MRQGARRIRDPLFSLPHPLSFPLPHSAAANHPLIYLSCPPRAHLHIRIWQQSDLGEVGSRCATEVARSGKGADGNLCSGPVRELEEGGGYLNLVNAGLARL